MKSKLAGISRKKTNMYLNKRRLMMVIKSMRESEVGVKDYDDNINQMNKWKSYMVGSTLFE